MSHLLLPTEGPFVKTSNLRHKPTELPRQLFSIIRGGTDAVEALELLLELCSESLIANDTTTLDRSGYLAFDAHVGDTACQLRACMLLEVAKLLRKPESYTVLDTIRSTLCDLKKVTEAAKRLLVGLLELDWNKIRAGGLEALKIPKAGMTVNELLVTLGWSGIRRDCFLYDSRSASSSESLASQDSPSSNTPSVYDSDMGSSSLSTPGPGSETSDDNDEINGVHWNPLDKQQVVRFVVYLYVLSKYKQLTSVGGVYRATLKPELAFETGQKLVQQEFGRQFVRPNKRAAGEEFTGLQRYVSELSCAWLGPQARKCWSLHPEHQSLLESTIRTSAKGVSSASSYVGYLVLRSLWGEESTPIIITTTRFCPSGKLFRPHVRSISDSSAGIHRNYFELTTHVERENDPNLRGSPVLPNVSWRLSRLTDKNLEDLSQDLEPHIMISGNSINGNAADYYSRLPSAHIHRDDQCCDNEKHCNDMLAADHDRVVQAIFAEHRHYAFELSGEESVLSEDVVVQRLMDESIPGMSAVWAKSRQEASELGTGPSYRLYMWQHVALESPARFLARAEGSDRPWIISSVV
jgi:hypothetical protein